MPSRNNILVFITVLIFPAQALPPNIGRGSYTYDPDSIAQNEKILRLFLHLASGTANHLIHLKNETQLHQVSTPRVDTNEPALRIKLPDENPERTSSKRGDFERKGQLMYPYGKKVDAKQSEEEPETPCVPDRRDSGLPARKENSQEILGKPEECKNLSTNHDSLEESINSLAMKRQFIEKLVPPPKSEEKLDEPSAKMQKATTIEDSTNLPMEIESRIMFNDQNHDHINYKEHSNTTSKSDARNASGNSSYQQESGHVSQMDPVTENQSVAPSEFHEIRISDNLNLQGVENNSSQSLDQAENEGSKLTSEDSAASTEKPANGTLNGLSGLNGMIGTSPELRSGGPDETATEGIDHQASGTASNLLSQSKETKHTARQLTSNGENVNRTVGTAGQDSNSTLNLQFSSTEITNAAQGLLSNGQSTNESAGIAHQVVGVGSSLQSESSGILNEAQGRESNKQNQNQPAKIMHQAVNARSNLQPSPGEKFSAFQNAGSNVLNRIIPTVNGNHANQIIKSQSGRENHENSEKDELSGLLDPTKSGGFLSNSGNVLMNQGSSLMGNTNHAVPAISNFGNETSDALIHAADAVGTSIQRGNPASRMSESNAGQISQIGSTLMGALPLFRSFPDSEDRTSLLPDKGRMENEDVTDDGVSDLTLNDFAKKFADALRPVESRQTTV